MPSFLDEDINKYQGVDFGLLWPVLVQDGEGKTLFHFKDKADYLLQCQNDPLVTHFIQLKGIDY
jgi:hypothetical protein